MSFGTLGDTEMEPRVCGEPIEEECSMLCGEENVCMRNWDLRSAHIRCASCKKE